MFEKSIAEGNEERDAVSDCGTPLDCWIDEVYLILIVCNDTKMSS